MLFMPSSSTLRIFRTFFPWTSSWFKPLFAPSAGSSVSSRAGDASYPLFKSHKSTERSGSSH